MKQKVKVGIIGIGTIGTVHADAFSANSNDAEIAIFCDINSERLKVMGEKYKVGKLCSDYKDVLKSNIDAVVVSVGNVLHKVIACAALKAGKNVLLEKPMAMNSKEAAEIVDAAGKSRKILQIGMVQRQRGDIQLARKYVEDGILGDIYHMRTVLIRRRGIPGLGGWFTAKSASGGGPLIDVGVHWFDAAMFISGHWNPTAVSAMSYSKFGNPMENYKYVSMWAGPPKYDGVCDTEDYATGFVRYGKKATMSFEIAWAANADDESFVEVLGTKGGIRVFSSKNPKLLTEYNGNLANIELLIPESGNSFQIQAKKFIDACRGERSSEVPGMQGLINMKLIDAIYESGVKGKEIVIK